MNKLTEYLTLKIPPGLQFLLGVSTIWLIKNQFPNYLLLFDYKNWVVLSLFALAGVFGISGLYEFYRHSTSIDPHKPKSTSSLVKTGAYRFSRNPMYLALLLGLISAVFYWGNIYSIIVPVFFIGYMNEFQILPEEKVLEEKFGEDFKSYKNKVRRWI